MNKEDFEKPGPIVYTDSLDLKPELSLKELIKFNYCLGRIYGTAFNDKINNALIEYDEDTERHANLYINLFLNQESKPSKFKSKLELAIYVVKISIEDAEKTYKSTLRHLIDEFSREKGPIFISSSSESEWKIYRERIQCLKEQLIVLESLQEDL